MREEILSKLVALEKQLDIVILYCVDVGKRALGNPREDQPYEIRFIYRKNVKEYIRLDEKVEDLDIRELKGVYLIGKDLKQFLKMMHEGRIEPFEWLSSPMVYLEKPYIQEIRNIIPQYFSERRSLNTYAIQVMQRGLRYLEIESFSLEYYALLIRAMLQCKWILSHHTMPPFTLEELATCIQGEDEVIRQAFDRLIEHIKTKGDLESIDREKILDEYVTEQFKKIAKGLTALPREQEKTWEPINEIFGKAFEENGHTNP